MAVGEAIPREDLLAYLRRPRQGPERLLRECLLFYRRKDSVIVDAADNVGRHDAQRNGQSQQVATRPLVRKEPRHSGRVQRILPSHSKQLAANVTKEALLLTEFAHYSLLYQFHLQ